MVITGVLYIIYIYIWHESKIYINPMIYWLIYGSYMVNNGENQQLWLIYGSYNIYI